MPAFQNYCYSKALEKGNIKAASSAIRWGASVYISRKNILKMLNNDKIDSIKFLISQIKFDSAKPYKNSRVANSIISARDDLEELNLKLVELLPYSKCPQTILYKLMDFTKWGPHDDYHLEEKISYKEKASV